MNENTKYLILNIIISAGIGILVGLVEVALPIMDKSSFTVIALDAFTGILIGTSIRYFSMFACDRVKPYKFFLGSALILAGIMLSIAALNHLLTGAPVFNSSTLILLLVAETLGMSWTYGSYRYYKAINDQLDFKKREFMN